MTNGIHPAPAQFTSEQLASDPILHFFHYTHLPPKLQGASRPFCDVAQFLIMTLPRNAERSVALRKLLEAKDAAVRANVNPDTTPVASADTFETRLLKERAELHERLSKLGSALAKGIPGVSDTQLTLLQEQHTAMCDYLNTLSRRCMDLGLIDEAGREIELGEIKEVGDHDIDRDGPIPFFA